MAAAKKKIVLKTKAKGKKAKAKAPVKKIVAKSHKRAEVVTELTAAQRKTVARIDAHEAKLNDAKIGMQTELQNLLNSLDGRCSFEHPERGPVTIMARKETLFWRGKPEGRGLL